MVQKRTGRVQFLVLLRLWTGPSQNNNNNNNSSSFRKIRFGVSQGSILGPLLFLCLLIDLSSIMEDSVTKFCASSSSVSSGFSG